MLHTKIGRVSKMVILVAVCFILLTGCSTYKEKDGYASQDELVTAYLKAVHDKDFSTIWNMLPKQIQEYGIETGIVNSDEAALDYVHYAVNDYFWLKDLDLPSHEKYSYEVKEKHDEDKAITCDNPKMVFDGTSYWKLTINADDVSVDGGIFMIMTNDRWFLISVVGDDELVEY